ncbi:MAG: hypothetical protein NTY12_04370 [Candidatus Falkowbacteria bacterium]|nr:hypothetical protein [Candidatus Falkowbacteria bacterium]
MPRKKIEKIKVKKVSKKTVKPRSKKTSRSKDHVVTKESAVLLSGEMHGRSIAHGHSPFQLEELDKKTKKIDDRSQRLIMYIGVSLIMVVIVVFWIINLKSSLGPDAFSITSVNGTKKETTADFENLKNDLSNSISEVKGQINSLEEIAKQKEAVPTSTANPATVSGTASPILPNTLPN